MGGLENYGADDFYNLDDTWNDDRRHHDLKPEVKAKVCSFNIICLFLC